MEKLSPILEQQVFNMGCKAHTLVDKLLDVWWAAVFSIVNPDGAQDELEGQGEVVRTCASTLDGQFEETPPNGVLIRCKVVVRHIRRTRQVIRNGGLMGSSRNGFRKCRLFLVRAFEACGVEPAGT